MKILDRFIIWTFIKNYLIAFFVLVGMYVALDMMFNFDELIEVQEKAGLSGVDSAWGVLKAAGDYYYYQMAVFYVHLSGMIPVVAAAFTLIRLSRFNELSAMLSAGVPLLRIASPIIIVAMILNGILLLDQELLIPRIIPKLVRSKQDAGKENASSAWAVQAMMDANHAVLNIPRYKSGPGDPTMIEPTIFERNESDDVVAKITARSAQWDSAGAQWKLTGGIRETMDPKKSRTIAPVETYKSNITPEEISLHRQGNYVEFLSTRRIDELLERPESYGAAALLRVKHARFTLPLVNIILILLAIPNVMKRQPTDIKTGSLKALGFTGACLVVMFLGQQLSGQPVLQLWSTHWPAMMAWLPILIFGPIAVVLLDRIET